MAPEPITKEEVKEFVQERVENNLAEVVEAAVKAVQEHLEDQLKSEVIGHTEKVLANLEDRGIDAGQEDVQKFAAESDLNVLSGGVQRFNIPVAPIRAILRRRLPRRNPTRRRG